MSRIARKGVIWRARLSAVSIPKGVPTVFSSTNKKEGVICLCLEIVLEHKFCRNMEK